MAVAPEQIDPARTLGVLRADGRVALPGMMSEPFRRWLRSRRRTVPIGLGVTGTGAVSVVIGLVLLLTGHWSPLIPLGVPLLVAGAFVTLLGAALPVAPDTRLRAETMPVILDATGVRLRGIGPIPWHDLAAPERRQIWTKNDVWGMCTVMPLTPDGRARVNAHLGRWGELVGPRPYLHVDVPYLLLPGIEGFSEDETMQLFRAAQLEWT